MEHLFFIINNTIAFTCASLLINRFLPTDNNSKLLRTLAVLIAFPMVCTSTILIAALCSLLAPLSVTIILLILCFILAFDPHKRSPLLHDSPDYKKIIVLASAGSILAAALLGFIIKHTIYGSDGLSYHSFTPALWIIKNKAVIDSQIKWIYYPYNSELFSLWFMLPYHDDALVGIVGYYWAIVLAVLILTYGHSVFKLSTINTAVILACILVTVTIEHSVKSFSAVDIVPPIVILAAILITHKSLCLSKINGKSPALIIGLFIGFAIGTKANALFSLIIWTFWILACRNITSTQQKIRSLILFFAGVTITAGYWYIRNIIITANPFYPAEFLFFNGPFTASDQAHTKMIHWFIIAASDKQTALKIITGYLDWPWPLALLSIFGYIVMIPTLFTTNKKNCDPTNSLLRWLFIASILSFVLYLFTPFSATYNRYNAQLVIMNRYLILQYITGFILLSAFCTKLKTSYLYTLLLIMIASIAYARKLGTSTTQLIIAVVLTSAIYFANKYIPKIKHTYLPSPIACMIIMLFFSCVSAYFHPYKAKATNDKLFSLHPVFKIVDTLPSGSTISVFDSCIHPYGYFGRKLQHSIILLEDDFSTRQPLYKRENLIWWYKSKSPEQYAQKFKLENVIKNISSSKSNYIIIGKRNSEPWPPQKDILLKSKLFPVVDKTPNHIIFINPAQSISEPK